VLIHLADTRGVKRKSETPPIKTAAPAKRVATAPMPSPAAAAAARLLAAKKEKEKEARVASGTVTKETKSDSSFFTDTKPKPAPAKRVLPSFTKKTPPSSGSDVAQPSNRNTFEEALAHMGVKPKASTPTVPEAMEGVTPSSSRAQSISVDLGKKRKRVTFKPEEHLVEVRWIEKAIYDDDTDAVRCALLGAWYLACVYSLLFCSLGLIIVYAIWTEMKGLRCINNWCLKS
jgi:protein phosphatase 1 regulatory subunit 10